MSLLRNTATIGGLTLVSRVAGFVRDMLMAQFVGAGLANDAFLIAWRLPNLFRALFAEGAFSSAFVPMFNREVGRNGGRLPSALVFADEVLALLFPVVLVFTILMMALAGPIVWAMTGGFPDGGPDKFRLAGTLTRWANWACVSLKPSWARRALIASLSFESIFCGATTSSARSTLVMRCPSVPLSA